MTRRISLKRDLLEGILAYSRDIHPKEAILLLRGRVEGDSITIEEVVVPPLAIHGLGFSDFNPYAVPFDPSIIGLFHTHPSGIPEPSAEDLNHFYGIVMIIAAYPYRSEVDVKAFDGAGEELKLEVAEGVRGSSRALMRRRVRG
ncbi:MAG: Mov34/MPN/PAD-1 family protein [Candidatus Bathyarchaeia archaeon]